MTSLDGDKGSGEPAIGESEGSIFTLTRPPLLALPAATLKCVTLVTLLFSDAPPIDRLPRLASRATCGMSVKGGGGIGSLSGSSLRRLHASL